ncbi:uncharacterized protein A1O9_11637 [Exophiala aquamarina CBS 119918]|uniref:Clr5 domain-containing protein n=1 Tax=Exophiala aquamarina CBS 119918 TaxID=1182545 RepID=A0A072NXS1_9EURO|nr:uncharacterized protein A1O9_11637 [Exophiala aquamarina CBS 119918]KEF52396.1 hypothetical protein A1O9_11637 [Exophiala aquamarina CBS 119918]
MEARKRFHPHTSKEWESFRHDFTRLYQVEGKKLREVVELLRDKGFQANEHHCKTYIKKWRLGKYKKELEMIFAAQIQARRQGKKTIFKSRGQECPDGEIQRYWSRRPEEPTDFEPIPKTPEGLEYWTPAPTPGGTMTEITPLEDVSSPEILSCFLPSDRSVSTRTSPRITEICDGAENNSPSSVDDTISVDGCSEACREYEQPSCPSSTEVAGVFLPAASQILMPNYQSLTLQPLQSPESIRDREYTLNCGREYFQWWIEKVYRARIAWNHTSPAVEKFRNASYSLASFIENDLSRDHIELTYLDLVEMTSHVLHRENPTTIILLMDIMGIAVQNFPKALPKIQKILDHALSQALESSGKDHPSTNLMRAIRFACSDFFDFASCAILPGKDLLAEALNDQNELVANLLLLLVDLGIRDRSPTAFQYAQELHQHALARYRTEKTDAALFSLSSIAVRITELQRRQGNYDEAMGLMKDASGRLSAFHDTRAQVQGRADLLLQLGYLKWDEGHFTAALDAFNQCLSLSLRVFGVDHYMTMHTAAWVRHAQKIVDQEARGTEMWSRLHAASL